MKNRINFLGLLACTALMACNSNETNVPTTTACGTTKTFTVDQAYCQEKNIAECQFTVEYPQDLLEVRPETGYKNQHYNYYYKTDDKDIHIEAISLGYSTTQRNTPLKETLTESILNQMKGSIQQMGFKLREITIGSEEFDGQTYRLMQAKGKINDPELAMVGDYLIQGLIVEPPVDNENGLFIMFFANEKSEIKTFEDFAHKGCISTVWQTLKFNY